MNCNNTPSAARLQSESKENHWVEPDGFGEGNLLERQVSPNFQPQCSGEQSTVVTPEEAEEEYEEEDGIVQYQTEDIISPGTVHYNTVLNSLPSAEMLKHVESLSQYSAENSTSSAQFRNTQFSLLSSPNTHENSVSSAQFRQAHPSSASSPVLQRNSFQGSPQQNRSSVHSSPLQGRTRENSPVNILYRRDQLVREQFSSSDTLSLHQRATQNRRESSLRNAQNCSSSNEAQNQLRTPQFSPMRGQGSFESSPRTRQSSLASSELCPSSPTVQCRSSSTVQFSSPSLPASSVQEVSPLPGAQSLPGNQNLPSEFPHCQTNLPTRSSWPDPGDPR